MPGLHGKPNILADAQCRKQVGDLERAADAGARDLLRRMSGDRLAHQRHLALIRRKHARQQIERGGLAGAIRSDQRMQGAICNRDVDALNRPDAAKALDDVAGGQHSAVDVRFGPQEFRQRQDFDPARRHRGVFGLLLAERRDQPLADADQTRRREHDESDKHQAEPEQPVLGVDAQKFAKQNKEQRAERRSQETAHAADHDHGQQIAGERDGDRIGRGHAVLIKQQYAGKPGDGSGQYERRELVAIGRIAKKACALLVLADRHQYGADGRIMEAPQQDQHQERDGRHEPVIDGRGFQVEAEQRWPRDAPQAVLAAGHFGPAKRHRIQHRGECQRQQREIHAAPPQDQESERRRNHRHDHNAGDGWAEKRVVHQVALDQRRRVGRKTEPGAVAE